MTVDTTPAIVRDVCEKDLPTRVTKVNGRPDTSTTDKILSQPKNTVSFQRGWGDSGYKVQVVEHECPADHCSHDRMIRRIDVSPERANEVRYWCLNPNCQYFVSDELSYACMGSYPQRKATEPAVFEKGES